MSRCTQRQELGVQGARHTGLDDLGKISDFIIVCRKGVAPAGGERQQVSTDGAPKATLWPESASDPSQPEGGEVDMRSRDIEPMTRLARQPSYWSRDSDAWWLSPPTGSSAVNSSPRGGMACSDLSLAHGFHPVAT